MAEGGRVSFLPRLDPADVLHGLDLRPQAVCVPTMATSLAALLADPWGAEMLADLSRLPTTYQRLGRCLSSGPQILLSRHWQVWRAAPG